MVTIDLNPQVAIVTGGAGELGRVMCRTLAAAGARVAVHYRSSEDKALRTVQEIREAGGFALAFQADITVEADVLRLRDEIEAEMGTPTIVVNNAVAQYAWVSVLEQSLADYESQFQSCVIQNVLMAKAFVPGMIEKEAGGRIIAINTECAMQNFTSQSAYVSGKRGMDGVLRVLAKEIGEHQITVNQVAPGWTQSERIRAGGVEQQDGYAKNVPLKRAGTDQEIANVVLFLASHLSSYITGAYIPVCGGNVMPTI
ncbi:MAG: SDR family NAD(P)-dependent oxidoreductase [Fimbriimonas sp.]